MNEKTVTALAESTTAEEMAEALLDWAEEMAASNPGVFTPQEWLFELQRLVEE